MLIYKNVKRSFSCACNLEGLTIYPAIVHIENSIGSLAANEQPTVTVFLRTCDLSNLQPAHVICGLQEQLQPLKKKPVN
jgi:hypothetical protein